MKPAFEDPRLFSVPAGSLALSGVALSEIMGAVLKKGRPFRFRAGGWSMAPLIRDGDVITLAPLAAGAPRPGDVVAFVRPETGQLVVHRVVSRRGRVWRIRGDSNAAACDDLVPDENLLGRVTRIERQGRPVRMGLGPERRLIAWLSNAGIYGPATERLAGWFKVLSGR